MATDVRLRCYCCGEALAGSVALVTMSREPVDRVFVANPEHLENFDDATTRSVLVTLVTA